MAAFKSSATDLKIMNITENDLNPLTSDESQISRLRKNGAVELVHADFFTQEARFKWTVEKFHAITDDTVVSDLFEPPFAPDLQFELLLHPDSGKLKHHKHVGFVGVFLYKATKSGSDVAVSVTFDLQGKSLSFDSTLDAYGTNGGFNHAIRRINVTGTFTLFVHMRFKNVEGTVAVPSDGCRVIRNYYDAINGRSTDFEILVGDRAIRVHSSILRINCDFFERKIDFTGHHELIIADFDFHTMMTIVIYIYTKMVAFYNVKTAIEVLRASHDFLLFDLAKLCAEYIAPRLTVRDALYVLRLAHETGSGSLQQSCIDLVVMELKNYTDIQQFPGYAEFRRSETFDKVVDQLLTAIYRKPAKI
ncbi:hypothetical protein HDE_14248 [Halotydeus destructor]|nr:hypothetical protein HDE_14248 [Halotydeus destructor]